MAGLYDNINAKRARIRKGSGEKMRAPACWSADKRVLSQI